MKTILGNSLLLLIFFFSPLRNIAQKHTGIIKGIIIPANGKPAVNVTVELKKLNRTSVTDENGNFILQHLPALRDTLIISSVDSKLFYTQVNLGVNQTLNIGIIKLEYNIQQLQT